MAHDGASNVEVLAVRVEHVREQVEDVKVIVDKLEQKLDARFAKLDRGLDRMSEAAESLQRVLNSHESRISKLEDHDKGSSFRMHTAVRWLLTVAGMVVGAFLLKKLGL